MKTITRHFILGGIGALLLAMAILFGIFDLQISTAIVQQENAFGLWVEFFGTLLGPWVFLAAGMICFAFCRKSPLLKNRRGKSVLSMLCILVGAGYCTWLYIDAGISFGLSSALICTGITIILFGLLCVYLKLKTATELYKLCYIAVVAIFYAVSVLIVINLIKVFWGRVRFREMENIAEFSAWYLPQGINGHRSFPSGHTANAAILYVLTLFAPLCRVNWKKAICYAIPLIFIVVMAASRVLVGAHYCSDVLFGALVSIGLFYLCKGWVLKLFIPAKKEASK